MSLPVELVDEQLFLSIYLQPKASKDAILGLHDNEIKVSITAPPVDGKANQHLIKFLAKLVGVAKSKVTILKGELSRHKQIKIDGVRKLPSVFEQL